MYQRINILNISKSIRLDKSRFPHYENVLFFLSFFFSFNRKWNSLSPCMNAVQKFMNNLWSLGLKSGCYRLSFFQRGKKYFSKYIYTPNAYIYACTPTNVQYLIIAYASTSSDAIALPLDNSKKSVHAFLSLSQIHLHVRASCYMETHIHHFTDILLWNASAYFVFSFFSRISTIFLPMAFITSRSTSILGKIAKISTCLSHTSQQVSFISLYIKLRSC